MDMNGQRSKAIVPSFGSFKQIITYANYHT